MFKVRLGLISFLFMISSSWGDVAISDQLKAVTSSQNYCVALRGNGFLISGQWGALARLVENIGAPSAMTGGSSSTVTMFLFESILQNPELRMLKKMILDRPNDNEIEQRYRSTMALYIKSLVGYVDYLRKLQLLRTAEALAFDKKQREELKGLLDKVKQSTSRDANGVQKLAAKIGVLFDVMTKQSARRATKIYLNDDFKLLFNKKLKAFMEQTAKMSKEYVQRMKRGSTDSIKEEATKLLSIINFREQQLADSLAMFGKFDAQDDPNLFFRHGLLDYEGLAIFWERVANFYSQVGFNRKLRRKWSEWTMSCSFMTKNKSWYEAAASSGKRYKDCVKTFYTMAKTHKKLLKRDKTNENSSKLKSTIGSVIPLIPTTTFLKGRAAQATLLKMKEFETAVDSNFGADFQVDINDFRLGYFGHPEILQLIERRLKTPFSLETEEGGHEEFDFSRDIKSQLFYNLGNSDWLNILTTSPAEPGLDRFKSISGHPDKVSTGGWFDHLGSPVLKALGCKNVISITRRGEATIFGQQMFEKLIDPLSLFINRTGESESNIAEKVFDLNYEDSSFNTSLKNFDGVVCTDWDNIPIEGLNSIATIFSDGYEAPLYFNTKIRSLLKTASADTLHLITDEDNTLNDDGLSKYQGCIIND